MKTTPATLPQNLAQLKDAFYRLADAAGDRILGVAARATAAGNDTGIDGIILRASRQHRCQQKKNFKRWKFLLHQTSFGSAILPNLNRIKIRIRMAAQPV